MKNLFILFLLLIVSCSSSSNPTGSPMDPKVPVKDNKILPGRKDSLRDSFDVNLIKRV